MQAGREAGAPPEFVTTSAAPLPGAPDFDVVVCGGTLGIFLACALLLQGCRRALSVPWPSLWHTALSSLPEALRFTIQVQHIQCTCYSTVEVGRLLGIIDPRHLFLICMRSTCCGHGNTQDPSMAACFQSIAQNGPARAPCRVAVVERGPLRGRSQEWNISRKELAELVRARLTERLPVTAHARLLW